MKSVIIALLFALSFTAQASTYNESGPGPIQDHTCQGGHNCNTTGGGSHNEQDQSQGQAQSQSQGQAQSQQANASVESSNINLNVSEGGSAYATGGQGGQGGQGGVGYASQGQNQSSDNSNSSNNSASQNINIQGDKNVGAHEDNYGNNVNAYAPAIYSSSACTAGGLSGGVSGLGFGVALGGAKQDPQCQVRENARILSGLDANLAIMYLCANPAVDIGTVLGSACKPADAPVPLPPVVPETQSVPVPQIDDKVKG